MHNESGDYLYQQQQQYPCGKASEFRQSALLAQRQFKQKKAGVSLVSLTLAEAWRSSFACMSRCVPHFPLANDGRNAASGTNKR